jgi:hypothetical protein
MKKIGFIIRTLNEERWIGHNLQSIIDSCGGKYEPSIVIIDPDQAIDFELLLGYWEKYD